MRWNSSVERKSAPRKVSGRAAGDAAGMHTKSTYLAPDGVDPEELARHIAEMYGADGISLLALKPVRAHRHTPHAALGGGADAARAALGESHPSPITTEEVRSD
jgi:hypothetical protein